VTLRPLLCSALLASCAGCTSTVLAPTTSVAPQPTTPGVPFVASGGRQTLYVGFGPMITPESSAQPGFDWNVTVTASGALRASLQRVSATLTDRTTGFVLGSMAEDGPFLNLVDPRYPGVRDPLLETGTQTFYEHEPKALGFVGRPALLQVAVVVKDTAGKEWTVSAPSVPVELYPQPTLRSPVGMTVRQNDPNSGCPFDPAHGYGILVDVSWDPPRGDFAIRAYSIAIADGAGTELVVPYPTATQTSFRFLKCGAHIPPGAERGARVAVSALDTDIGQMSGFAVAHFDFQSCTEAGTPACQR
jgi:hypothetical protein